MKSFEFNMANKMLLLTLLFSLNVNADTARHISISVAPSERVLQWDSFSLEYDYNYPLSSMCENNGSLRTIERMPICTGSSGSDCIEYTKVFFKNKSLDASLLTVLLSLVEVCN